MVTPTSQGTCVFRVFLPHASNVQLVGDFTDWRTNAMPMRREHPGWWELEAPIPGGEHHFCYLVDGHIWLADYAAHGVKLNGYGGWISRLVMAPSAASVEPKPTVAAAA